MSLNNEVVDRKVLQILKIAYKNDRFTFASYSKAYRNFKKDILESRLGKSYFRKQVLRNLGLKYFDVYATMLGFPVYDSPKHLEIIDKIENSSKPIVAISIPRGTWKSVLFGAGREEWIALRAKIIDEQSTSCCFLHGNKDKAGLILGTIAKDFATDIIQYLYGDVLEVDVDNANELRFVDNFSKIRNTNADFSIGSPDTDLTGKHFGRMVIDDWNTAENSDTLEKTEHLMKQFYRLFSLEDHALTEFTKYNSMPIVWLCTFENEKTVTFKLFRDEEWEDLVERIEIPAEVVDEEGNRHLNFPSLLDEKKLDHYKKILPAKQYNSQYCCMFYRFDMSDVHLDFNLPPFYNPFDARDDRYRNISWCGLVVDPAIRTSVKTKRKSLMSIMCLVYTDERKLFVIDGSFDHGTTPTEFREKIKSYTDRYPVTDVIIENIAAQEYMVKDLREYLISGYFRKHFNIITHAHYVNKKQHYLNFLEPLFSSKLIYVAPHLTELLSEIRGDSPFDDALDCLSFVKEKKLSFVPRTITNEMAKKAVDFVMDQILKQHSAKKVENNNIFSTITKY